MFTRFANITFQGFGELSIIGAALPYAVPPINDNSPQHGNRVWAPSIRYHNGEFYIFWGDPDQGVYMVKSSKVEGP